MMRYTNEPRLQEVFDDPITHSLMQRDGVGEHELRELLRRTSAQLQRGQKQAAISL